MKKNKNNIEVKDMKKHKFVQNGPDHYPYTAEEFKLICSHQTSIKKPTLENISVEIWEEHFKNPIAHDVDEFSIEGDDLCLFYRGKQIDEMHIIELIRWALDIDKRWNCHWIE